MLLAALILPDPLIAETFTVQPGGKTTINRHGVCQVVTNAGDAPMMVPTLNREEWSVGTGAFLQNTRTMPHVGIQACFNETPMTANLFMRACSERVLDPNFVNAYVDPDYFLHGGYPGMSADNFFYDNLEYSCETRPVRGSDGRIYIHYMQRPDVNGVCAVNRWFNDQGELINPTTLGLTFNPISLPACVTPAHGKIDVYDILDTRGHTRPSDMSWGAYFARYLSETTDFGLNWIHATEGGYWANNHSPRIHPWNIKLGSDVISASWPADPAAEGCTLDFMHIDYQGRLGQTFTFVFLKEWENGPALLD